MADDGSGGAQVWGTAVVMGSALAVVAAYLVNGAALVLTVAGVETLLLMVYVARRWRALRTPSVPRGHRTVAGSPDASHCERCRRAREALDGRAAGKGAGAVRAAWTGLGARPRSRALDGERADGPPGKGRAPARQGLPGSAGDAVRHQ
ncbi:hypothetical protein ACWEQL_22765 [Kitasatospora sp. NPDC004240]